jgi:hypothetical protein
MSSILGKDQDPNELVPYVLRAVFTIYWMNDYPSTEVFYLPRGSYNPGVVATNMLEQHIIELLQANYPATQPLRAVFVTQAPFEVTATEVSELAWRVITTIM